MTFPNPDLGPFEGENEAWRKHKQKEFARLVTGPMLENRECSAAQAAVLFLHGFINCAFEDAMERGDGQQQIMPDVLEKIRPWVEGLKSAEALAIFDVPARNRFTVLPGGRKDDEE